MAAFKIKKNGQWVQVGIGAEGKRGPEGPPGPAGAGSGDMLAEVYDPQGKRQDIFEYVDEAVSKSASVIIRRW